MTTPVTGQAAKRGTGTTGAGMRQALRGLVAALTVSATALSGVLAPGTGFATGTSAGVSRAEERVEARAIPDIPLQLADGRKLALSALAGGKPLLVTFFYRRCTGVCIPMLEWIRDAVREVGGLGTDYRVLALSFDDADTVADLRAQALAIGVSEAADWTFAITEHEALSRITGAADFWYRRDPVTGQFDHPALVLAVDAGRVVRAMLGTPGEIDRFRELIWELRGAFIPSYRLPGQTALSCLSFDPDTGTTRLAWGLAILALPGMAALVAALGVFFSPWRRRPSPGSA